jgi:cellulose synthase/poly-beta-1,6-N-acetylglucosamine synthase-like glycosyltransferase/peptidoglycan/xylan/chitin deacetylase (PgdA/CDA1 family)
VSRGGRHALTARRSAPSPQAHWLVLLGIGLVVAALLAINAITHNPPGEGSDAATTPHGSHAVPETVRAGGPVLDASHPEAPGRRVPDRTIVLTFDDGPSAYTPKILDVLERFHVPATFFVIGADLAGHAGTLRRMVADGDELGVHTFTHPDLGSVPAWREHAELDTTQLAIASATGYLTDLLRLPYSSTVAEMTEGEWAAVRDAGSYRVVFTDLDTRDWARPGVGRIVDAAIPAKNAGAVVMLHDGGGDRNETVAALARLIPKLLARGYHFETVSHAIGVPSPWSPATAGQRLRGDVLTVAVFASRWLVTVLEVLFAVTGGLAVLRTIVLLVFARRHARAPTPAPGPLPPITVVVPAYNERAGIEACVRSLVASDYPEVEILVVDDGSTDGTADVVEQLRLPNVRVIRQLNAGKPAALTRGVAEGRHDLFVLVDGDTVFEKDSLRALAAPFAAPHVGAVSGNTKVGNRGGLLGRWQHIEYVIGFNLDRRMFDVLQCMPTVPGAIGAFRREALDAVGGVTDDTLAEDTDLTMAICRAGYRVVYAPDARAWTEAPATLGALWRQRYRWCYGTLQAMWKHRAAVVHSGASGRFGRRGLPYLLTFQVALPLLAPVIDVAALAQIFAGEGTRTILAWLAFLVVQLVGAVYAFRLDGERLRTLWALPLQQFVYRQLMYLVVIQSAASALYGVRLRWHKLERTGQLEDAPVPS